MMEKELIQDLSPLLHNGNKKIRETT